ncbi:NAD(P)H-dependent oxidoreductase [Dyadobacter frigoris]|uniref:NAD(P)H-dependent oxidoreductase n=1 Tax=Dyadobacter frigoris TaxID=2576211 RepID=A0A4U6CSW2_9BACT|nr:NAD(P)H-dependent oxidoreductase [Dyadobacter frigoris]TKT87672.1 NAD(P)H-dependent oxidoreductase [Dyadobacter frigoris]
MAIIILAHPNFEKSVANKSIIENVRKCNPDIEIRNIFSLYPDYKIDVQAEQQILLKHNTIVFQYPFYWYNMPAILKQWFDVVFEYQFAYGSKGDKLKGKNFLPSFTVGAPESGYRTLGDHHFRVLEFCKNMEQTAYYAQMNYIDPIYFTGTSLAAGYTVKQVTDNAKNHSDRLIQHLDKLQ